MIRALLALLLLAGARAQGLEIHERPLPWDEQRRALTVDYLSRHRTAALTGDAEVDTRMTPRVVVLHWTAGSTAASAWNTFAPARLGGRPELQAAGALNVGAHYLVDRDGTIWRLFPDEVVLRHVIGLNHLAIGIENVGGGERWPLTEAQVQANAALVRDLAARHPLTHLVGHFEAERLRGHPYFEERDPGYRSAKADPGDAFMAAVRAALSDLGLQGPPEPAAPGG